MLYRSLPGRSKGKGNIGSGKPFVQRLERQRFNMSKLNDLEVRKQYQIDITNRYAALENLNEDINRTSENIKENIKTSAKESLVVHEWKQHKPWFFGSKEAG